MSVYGNPVPDKYGNIEINPLPENLRNFKWKATVDWTDEQLARIVRLRLIRPSYEEQRYGAKWYDVSYCYGFLKDGTPVRVIGLGHLIPVKGNLQVNLVQLGREHKVYVKGLGLLDEDVVSIAPH